MTTAKKIVKIVLYLLPLVPLLLYGINMISDGATFNSAQVGQLIEELRYCGSEWLGATFGEAFIAFESATADSLGAYSPYIFAVIGYLLYCFIIEILSCIFDLLTFVPRKCSEIFR